MRQQQRMTTSRVEVRHHHLGAHLAGRCLRLPNPAFRGRPTHRQREIRPRLGENSGGRSERCCVSRLELSFNHSANAVYYADLIDAAAFKAKGHAQFFGCPNGELPDRILDAGGNHKIPRLVLLKHQPLGPDIIAGMSPVAQGVEVAKEYAILETLADITHAPCDLSSDERLTAPRALMIEEDAVAGKDSVPDSR